MGEKDWVFADPSNAAPYTFFGLQVGVSANLRLSAVRTSELSRDAAKARWFTVFGEDAGVRGSRGLPAVEHARPGVPAAAVRDTQRYA